MGKTVTVLLEVLIALNFNMAALLKKKKKIQYIYIYKEIGKDPIPTLGQEIGCKILKPISHNSEEWQHLLNSNTMYNKTTVYKK